MDVEKQWDSRFGYYRKYILVTFIFKTGSDNEIYERCDTKVNYIPVLSIQPSTRAQVCVEA